MLDEKTLELKKHLETITRAHIDPALHQALAVQNAITETPADVALGLMTLLQAGMLKPLVLYDGFLKLTSGWSREKRHENVRAVCAAILADAILMSDRDMDEQGKRLRPDGTREDERDDHK